MLKVISYILCDLDPKVKVMGKKAGICDGVPSTSALVNYIISIVFLCTAISISRVTLITGHLQKIDHIKLRKIWVS